MKNRTIVFLIFESLFLCFNANAQSNYPKDYFRSPLDIPLKASAYFGDVRRNHFHSGLDLRTEKVEGKNVYAVADGVVSRIRVSAFGFGYAVYIMHPNGYTSVYGHLQQYSKKISDYILARQYEKESFEIDYFPNADELPVKKGEIIGLSGNSGGSEGPHLHFELRNSKTEETINPLLMGIKIPDNKPPVVKAMYIYPIIPLDQRPLTKVDERKLNLEGGNGNYVIPAPVLINGSAGFGISCFDNDNVSGGNNSVYKVEILLDGKNIFGYELEKFFFSETRYVNAFIDYEEMQESKKEIELCYGLPGNKAGLYKPSDTKGIISLKDDLLHEGLIKLTDVSGNFSFVKFKIKNNPEAKLKPEKSRIPKNQMVQVFPVGQKNSFQTEQFKIDVPENALYDSIVFEYSKVATHLRFYSEIHAVHNVYTPVHSNISLSIKTTLPKNLFDKAVVVQLKGNNVIITETAKVENGFASATVKSFGNYAVMADTSAPVITPLNISAGKNMAAFSTISFRIRDNLSGIKTYRGTIDGKWVLFVHDSKTSMFTYTFDKNLAKGNHKIKMVVMDKCGNSRSFEAPFLR